MHISQKRGRRKRREKKSGARIPPRYAAAGLHSARPV